jgi:hypothetical protein
MSIPKPFIRIGTHLINMNTIASVVQAKDGHLRIRTTAIKSGGGSHSFVIPAGEHATEFQRQIAPYVAVNAGDIEAVEE